jgi:glyoxylase-like metal-dependent hydrolase (beta-lactamase superfamily II)
VVNYRSSAGQADEVVRAATAAGGEAVDVMVYEPLTRAAWTGNFLPRAGVGPMPLEGGPGTYIDSLKKMRDTIDVKTVVPGRGPMGDGREAIDTMIGYLSDLQDSVRTAVRNGRQLEDTVESARSARAFRDAGSPRSCR